MADTYTVISQRSTSVRGAGGLAIPAQEITFETFPSGVQGVVTVPLSQLTSGAVDLAIRGQAATLEAIQNL